MPAHRFGLLALFLAGCGGGGTLATTAIPAPPAESPPTVAVKSSIPLRVARPVAVNKEMTEE